MGSGSDALWRGVWSTAAEGYKFGDADKEKGGAAGGPALFVFLRIVTEGDTRG